MRYDVAVIGAGPAGAASALHLARAGAHVCIIERAQFPRTKACGEYLSAGALRLLEALGVAADLAQHAVGVQGIRLFGNGTHAELDFSSPGWSLSRATLDDTLLNAAVHAGAIRMQGRAEWFVREQDAVRIGIRSSHGTMHQIQAAVLIGADGTQSLVAREFGLSAPRHGSRRFAIGGHYAGLQGLDHYLEMFVDGSSYFAINPIDETRANVMLIVEEDFLHANRDDIEGFLRQRAVALSGGRIRFENASLEGKRIAVGPLSHHALRYSVPRVLLVGDAAQFLDPFTGQGVYLALRGAQLAAPAVHSRFFGEVREGNAGKHYESRLRREMRRRSRLSGLVGLLVRVPQVAKRAAWLARRRPRAFGILLDAVTGAT
jgi:2-polyprenyl-6-methoxyphenol hydroxylase-like FAD-dependent oxidoreductase